MMLQTWKMFLYQANKQTENPYRLLLRDSLSSIDTRFLRFVFFWDGVFGMSSGSVLKSLHNTTGLLQTGLLTGILCACSVAELYQVFTIYFFAENPKTVFGLTLLKISSKVLTE